MLNVLPMELVVFISDYLDIRDKIALMNSCGTYRYLFYPQMYKVASTAPIKITVDFSRGLNHHINIHNVWIKIGWFTPKLAVGKDFDIEHTLEFCSECLSHRLLPDSDIRGIYVVVKKIYDVNVFLSLCSRKECCIKFEKTYFPRILGFSREGLECKNIYIGQVSRLKNKNSKLILGSDRSLILEYGNHRLYRNMVGYQPLA